MRAVAVRRVAPWVRAHPVLVASAVLAVPLVVAAVVLLGQAWAPVLDLAMTELRVRDVGTAQTPLVGLPGRIGDFPAQGSHPGPLSFYLLAPTYRLLGETGPALEVGMVIVSIVAIVAALFLARRRGGAPLILGVALLLAVLLILYGPSVLTQPWNPYVPVLAWVVVLLATWSVLDGDAPPIVLLVGFGSLAAQTHLPYAGLCGGMAALAVGTVVVRVLRAPTGSPDRGRSLRWTAGALALGVLLWLPPVLDELFGHGNLSTIVEHFRDPPEPPVGLARGSRLVLERFDLVHVLDRPDYSRLIVAVSHRSHAVPAIGAVFLGMWAAAAVMSLVAGLRRLWPLHATVAAALALGLVSLSRIFGGVWFYLSLWMVSIVILAMFATIWTAMAWWGARRPGHTRAARAAVAAGVVATVALVAAVTVQSATMHPPEDNLSEVLATLAARTDAALRDGAAGGQATTGRYLVTWDDAQYIGAQGYGLVNELERRGYDVGVPQMFRVPTTRHRVLGDDRATAELRLVTGASVEAMLAAGDPNVTLVARVDPRDADEQRRYDRVRRHLRARLGARGLTEQAAQVDVSLFALSLDSRLDREEHRLVTELLQLGQDTAVFVVPVGFRR